MLHRTNGHGEDFLLLGVLFDVELRMGTAVTTLAREAGWRLRSVLRPRRFSVVNLYKSQVLSFLESGTPAYMLPAPFSTSWIGFRGAFFENTTSVLWTPWIATI